MILLLDSSSTHLSVALAENETVLVNKSYYAWQSQSELMVPEIVSLFSSINRDFSQLKAVSVAIGPGSYTGVRIALTIAKIIGYALRIPVYASSSLKMLQLGEKPTICLINARSGRSYIGVYQASDTLLQDTIMTNSEVHDYILSHPDYQISGSLEYLNLVGVEINIFDNLLQATKTMDPVSNIHALKPVYLKDNL